MVAPRDRQNNSVQPGHTYARKRRAPEIGMGQAEVVERAGLHEASTSPHAGIHSDRDPYRCGVGAGGAVAARAHAICPATIALLTNRL